MILPCDCGNTELREICEIPVSLHSDGMVGVDEGCFETEEYRCPDCGAVYTHEEVGESGAYFLKRKDCEGRERATARM